MIFFCHQRYQSPNINVMLILFPILRLRILSLGGVWCHVLNLSFFQIFFYVCKGIFQVQRNSKNTIWILSSFLVFLFIHLFTKPLISREIMVVMKEETENIDLFSSNLSKKSNRLLLDWTIKYIFITHIITI